MPIRYKVIEQPAPSDQAPDDEYEMAAAELQAALDELSESDPAAALDLCKRMLAMLPKAPGQVAQKTAGGASDLVSWVTQQIAQGVG